MNFLFVTTSLPNLAKNGGEIVTLNFIDALRAAGHRCDVAGYARAGSELPEMAGFHSARDWPIETQTAGMMPYWWMTKAIATGLPFSVVKFISTEMRNLVQKLTSQNTYDAIVVDHANMGWVLEEPGLPNKAILIAHNVECDLYRNIAEIANPGPKKLAHEREARALLQAEQFAAGRVDQIWTLSQQDAAWFAKKTDPSKIVPFDVPGGVEVGRARQTGQRFPVGLLGSWSWQANHVGLVWFLEEVVPLIDPSVEIYVAGNGADPKINPHKNVHLIGFQDSAQGFFQSCNCLVIPSTSGGGVQIKSIEAISAGVPTVATSFALRGLSNVPDFVLRIDTPKEMADAITRLSQVQPTQDDLQLGQAWLTDRTHNFRARIDEAVANLATESDLGMASAAQ